MDEDLINNLFWPVDAHRIMQIPFTSDREDVVAWHYNQNGSFSVQSAYHCQWLHKFGENRVNRGCLKPAQFCRHKRIRRIDGSFASGRMVVAFLCAKKHSKFS